MNIALSGALQVYLNDDLVREVPNMVVSTGISFVSSRMHGTSASVMSHLAIGSDNTAAAANQTALLTELARVALTSTTVSGAQVTYVASIPPGTGTGNVTEAGILNAGSAGTMLCRSVFDAVTKGATDTMQFNWVLTVS
tara:strand:- start:1329 stop:1745 length:417 start_codon:yes stop_codon:yes gene_type:complete